MAAGGLQAWACRRPRCPAAAASCPECSTRGVGFSAKLQVLRRSNDFFGRGELPTRRRAFGALDARPAHDAAAIDQKLTFKLGPLPLHVGAIGLVVFVAVELSDGCGCLRDGQGLRQRTFWIDLNRFERM